MKLIKKVVQSANGKYDRNDPRSLLKAEMRTVQALRVEGNQCNDRERHEWAGDQEGDRRTS